MIKSLVLCVYDEIIESVVQFKEEAVREKGGRKREEKGEAKMSGTDSSTDGKTRGAHEIGCNGGRGMAEWNGISCGSRWV